MTFPGYAQFTITRDPADDEERPWDEDNKQHAERLGAGEVNWNSHVFKHGDDWVMQMEAEARIADLQQRLVKVRWNRRRYDELKQKSIDLEAKLARMDSSARR